jgi:hypothetical protein
VTAEAAISANAEMQSEIKAKIAERKSLAEVEKINTY